MLENREYKKPVRDNTGKFVKGHEPLTRPKYDLMRKYPKLLCDTCCIRSTCPDFQEECVCSHKRELKRFKTRDTIKVVSMLRSVTESSLTEMSFYIVQETMSGELDQKVSRLMSRNIKRLVLLYQLYEQMGRVQSLYQIRDL